MWRILKGVCFIEQRSVVEGRLSLHCASVAVVDVAEDVDFWLDFVHFLPQFRAASVDSFGILVQNEMRRPVCDEQIDAFRNCRPQHLGLGAVILKPPIVKERLIWRSKDLDAFHLHSLMLQVYTMLLQPLQLQLRIQLLVGMSLRLMLSGIILHIIDEVMIASDHYLMLVWQ